MRILADLCLYILILESFGISSQITSDLAHWVSTCFNSFWEDRVELPFTSIHMEQYAFEVSWLRLTLLDFEKLLENSVWSTVMRIITHGRVKILGNSAGRDRADMKHPISHHIPDPTCLICLAQARHPCK